MQFESMWESFAQKTLIYAHFNSYFVSRYCSLSLCFFISVIASKQLDRAYFRSILLRKMQTVRSKRSMCACSIKREKKEVQLNVFARRGPLTNTGATWMFYFFSHFSSSQKAFESFVFRFLQLSVVLVLVRAFIAFFLYEIWFLFFSIKSLLFEREEVKLRNS